MEETSMTNISELSEFDRCNFENSVVNYLLLCLSVINFADQAYIMQPH